MAIDLVYFLLFLGGLQLPQYWRHLPAGEFVIAFSAPLSWVLCAILGFSYPFLAKPAIPSPFRAVLRIISILIVSLVIDFVIYRCGHRNEAFDMSWRSTLYFFAFPCIITTLVGALIGGALKKPRT